MFVRLLHRHKARMRSATPGVIDLLSIMVGVIILGILAGGVVAMVFGVVPWAQDNAAKDNLAAVRTAESVAMAGEGYLPYSDLVSADLIQEADSLGAVTDPDGTCYVSGALSATGKNFISTSAGPEVIEYISGVTDPAFYNWCVATGEVEGVLDDLTLDPNASYIPLNTCDDPNADWVLADPAVEAQIRGMLSLDPSDPLLVSDAAGPSYLPLGSSTVQNLGGIECMTNVGTVALTGTSVVDLSPLSILPALNQLILSGNVEISSLATLNSDTLTRAVIMGNTALESFNIGGDKVPNLSFATVNNNPTLQNVSLHDLDQLGDFILGTNNTDLQSLNVNNVNSSALALTFDDLVLDTISVTNSVIPTLGINTATANSIFVDNVEGGFIHAGDNTVSTIDFSNITAEDFQITENQVAASISATDINASSGTLINDNSAPTISMSEMTGGPMQASFNTVGSTLTATNITSTDYFHANSNSATDVVLSGVEAGADVEVSNSTVTNISLTDVDAIGNIYSGENVGSGTTTIANATAYSLNVHSANLPHLILNGVDTSAIYLLDNANLSTFTASSITADIVDASGATGLTTVNWAQSITGLTDLNIRNTGISTLVPLHNLNGLQTLDIDTNMSTSEVNALAGALPGLTINQY